MATGRNDWRPRPPHAYSGSYDSYFGSSEGPAPSYAGRSYYSTPRSGCGGHPLPPSHTVSHSQHSPMVSRSDSDYYYHDIPHSRSLSPTHGAPPHHAHGGHPYERPHPAVATTPYRAGRATPNHRSQFIHRGTPPYSARGDSIAAVGTPRSHGPRPYADVRQPGYFPDSPFAGRNRNLHPAQPRASRIVMPMHRQQLPQIPRHVGLAPWEPPSPQSETQKKSTEDEDDEEPEYGRTLSREQAGEGENDDEEEDKGGDPLALLAKVSSDMETKPGQKQKTKLQGKQQVSSVPPTSPLRRTTRTSPVITPTTDNTSSNKRKAEVQLHLSFPEVPPPPRSAPPPVNGPKAVTPMPPYYPPYGDDPRGPPPPYHYSGPPPSRNAPGYQPYPPPPHRGAPAPPPSWQRGAEQELGPPPSHPVVVERHSFDSHDSGVSHDTSSLPPPSRRYYGQPPHAQNSFGPPRDWPGSPPPAGPPVSGSPHGQPYSSRFMYGGPTPPVPPRPSDPYHAAPYSYVQQSQMEEKTVLRRKFSWKHYPELERFLIANRDDYLEHSSKNYTAEQKQYNNWLTEQLLAVAEQHNYTFDPEDFNFVAIRDRIRCYYKSYVQTARKRGMELPGKAHIKKHRPANSLDKYAEEKSKKLLEEQGEGGYPVDEEGKEEKDDIEISSMSKQAREGTSTESKTSVESRG